MKQKAFPVLVLVCSLLFMYQCGEFNEPEPVPSLDIVIFNVENDVPVETLTAFGEEFKSKHENIVVNTTPETIAPDETYANLQEKLKNVDVVIYPSKLQSTFETQKSAFYPISVTDTLYSKTMLDHFKTPSGEGVWTLPFLYDPVVMLIKKSAVDTTGDTFFPREWAKIEMISLLISTVNQFDYPHIVFYDPDGYGFTDTLAAFYLSRGLLYDVVTGKGLSFDETQEQHEDVQYQILQTLPAYITGDREKTEFEITKVKNWDELNQSKSMITFIRNSDYLQAPKEIQDQYFMGIAPNPYDEKPVLCYSINTAVTTESDEPNLAKQFISELTKMKTITNSENNASRIYLTNEEMENNNLIPPNHFYIIRSNAKQIHEKAYFDTIQQKEKTLDFGGIWLSAFSVIHEINPRMP